jgi:hypothetical protein
LEWDLQEQFYACDNSGNTHALLSRAEFDQCTVHDHVIICRIARPTIKKQSECHNALHFDSGNPTRIFNACKFRKADGTLPKFLSISPNRFAFFLQGPATLQINCPKSGYKNSTELPRSGIFAFPGNCDATIAEFQFHDTSTTLIDETMIPQRKMFDFLSFARGPWPALYASNESQHDVIRAAMENNSSEPLTSVGTRANIYKAFRNLKLLGADTKTSKEFYDSLYYYVAAMSVFLSCQLLHAIWKCICDKPAEKRNYDFRRFPRFKRNDEERIHNDFEEEMATMKRQLRALAGTPPRRRNKDISFHSVSTVPAQANARQQPVQGPSQLDIEEQRRALDEFESTHTYQFLAKQSEGACAKLS